MIFLKTLGEIIVKTVKRLVRFFETIILGKKRPRRLKTKSFVLTFMLMICTLCLGGVTQVYLEGWTFVEGIYAYFATLSTIGYGDYIPGWKTVRIAVEQSGIDNNIDLWIVVSILALPGLAGLCVVSGVLNSLVDALDELKIHFYVRKECLKCETKTSTKCEGLHEEGNLFIEDPNKRVDQKIGVTLVEERTRSATL